MQKHENQLENIANSYLTQDLTLKPNFTNREFMNALLIFQTALVDKSYDFMLENRYSEEEQLILIEKCGNAMRELILSYTGLDTHDAENFL